MVFRFIIIIFCKLGIIHNCPVNLKESLKPTGDIMYGRHVSILDLVFFHHANTLLHPSPYSNLTLGMKKETFLVKISEDIWWASQCIKDLSHQIHFWIRNIEKDLTLLKKMLSCTAMNMKKGDRAVREDEKALQLTVRILSMLTYTWKENVRCLL